MLTRTPLNFCPHCGKDFDAASDMSGRGGARPGDGSLCIRCAQPLAVRKPFPGEWDRMLRDRPGFRESVTALRRAIALADLSFSSSKSH